MPEHLAPSPVAPSTVAHPWQRTLRTALALLLTVAVLLPVVAATIGLDPAVYPWVGGVLAVAAGFTRVMALPQVEAFLRRFAPWLSADDVVAGEVVAVYDAEGRVIAGAGHPAATGTPVELPAVVSSPDSGYARLDGLTALAVTGAVLIVVAVVVTVIT